MASSSSTNSSEELNNTSNQLSETIDKNKQDLPTSSSNMEEIIEEDSVIITRSYATRISASFVAPSEKITSKAPILCARPFEEILVGQPDTDVSPGSFIKPDGNKSSFK